MATKADLEERIRELEAKLSVGEEGLFLLVENLTIGTITLPHPDDGPDGSKSRTLGPREIALLDPAFLNHPSLSLSKKDGLIDYRMARTLGDDDGRVEALGEQHRMKDPEYEAAVRKFLLFPGKDLGSRKSEGTLSDVRSHRRVQAQVLWEMINFSPSPRSLGHVDVDYLQTTHLYLLENILLREKIWRNRPGIIGPIEKRIAEIRRMDRMGRLKPGP